MYVLGIDTSAMTGGAAVVRDGQLLGEYALNIRTTHSERLLPAVERLLEDSGLSMEEVEGIAVVTGPGSFTGIRIGVATAKGFAYALNKQIVGVTALQALGRQFTFFPGIVAALIDARRSTVYAQLFQGGMALTDPWNGPLTDVLARCEAADQSCLMVGDGAVAYRVQIEQTLPNAVYPPDESIVLRPSVVAGWGYHKIKGGQVDDLFSLNPVYLRKTEAEMKWMSRPQ